MKDIDNEKDLTSAVRNKGKTFVLFYSSWCPFCRMFLPNYEECSGQNKRDEFLRVRIDDEDNPLWEKYDVDVVPTVILFKDKKVERRLDGKLGVGLTKNQLKIFCGKRNYWI